MTKVSAAPPTASVMPPVGSESLAHTAVMLNEAVDALSIKPSGTYIDCTFGRGGHSKKILERLDAKGRLFAIDRDLAAIKIASLINNKQFHIDHLPFSALSELVDAHQLTEIDGVLLDLGISSPQIDEGERGFSFRFD